MKELICKSIDSESQKWTSNMVINNYYGFMQNFKSIIAEVKKHTVLYVLSIIAVITWGIVFYLKIADEIHVVAKEIGAALAM